MEATNCIACFQNWTYNNRMNVLDNYVNIAIGNLEVYYIPSEGNIANLTLEGLSAALPVVCDFFGLNEFQKVTTAVIAPNRDEFDRLVKDYLEVEIEQPSNPARIAQAQRSSMVLLSPNAYETESVFRYIPQEYERLLAHEFVHIIEEFLSPDIESSQRWWGEGLAVYCSGQWNHEEDFFGNAVAGVRNRSIPNLSMLVSNPGLAYDWGWTVVWYIDHAYGRAMPGKIVRECKDGNVFDFLGNSMDAIGKRWSTWLISKIDEVF